MVLIKGNQSGTCGEIRLCFSRSGSVGNRPCLLKEKTLERILSSVRLCIFISDFFSWTTRLWWALRVLLLLELEKFIFIRANIFTHNVVLSSPRELVFFYGCDFVNPEKSFHRVVIEKILCKNKFSAQI